MASDILFGRKPPQTGDTSVGEMQIYETRTTWLATPSDDYWVTHGGAHVGWDGVGTPPTVRIVTYNADDNAIPQTKLAETEGYQTKAIYKPSSPSGGENVQLRFPAPLMFKRGLTKAGGVHASGRHMTMGQNADGSYMSRDQGENVTPPPTFNVTRRDRQGRLAMWVVARKNSPPDKPSNPSPTPGSQLSTLRPKIEADFRDPDETLTGFGLGQADRLDGYQVIVYNENKSAKIWESGIIEGGLVTAAEVNNRRFSITPDVDLASGKYTFWCRVKDRMGAWSQPLEWQASIVSGGVAFAILPEGRITTTTTTFLWGYTHPEGVALEGVNLRLVDPSGNIIRGDYNSEVSVIAGGFFSSDWPLFWEPLPRGTVAFVEAQAISTGGILGAWIRGDWGFHVNAIPLSPANHSPENGAVVTTRAPFRVTAAADADGDDPSGYSCTATITRDEPGAEAIPFTMGFVGWSGDLAIFEGTPPVDAMPAYDTYTWSAVLTDQYGQSSENPASITFNYAEPPAITITAPATDTVTEANPLVTFTSDPAATKQRVRWVDAETNTVVHDSGLVNASGEDRVAAGEIRNGKSYDVIVGVLTGLGAYGEVVKRVNVAFVTPDALPNQRVTLEYGKYDLPGEPTVATLRWDDPVGLSALDFRGFGVYRQEEGGPEELMDVVTNMSAREWTDDTTRLNAKTKYWATVFEDEGLDVVESPPPATIPEITMNFGGTIITDISSPGENRIVARYWLERREIPKRNRETHEGWTQYPTLTAGELHYTVLSGIWDLHEESEFNATELKDAMIALADPVTEQRVIRPYNGGEIVRPVRVPRRVCYRDGLGRRLYGAFEVHDSVDTKREPHDVSWTFTETGQGNPPAQRPGNPTTTEQSRLAAIIDVISGIVQGAH